MQPKACVRAVPPCEHSGEIVSSTRIRRLIEGKLEEAHQLLGRTYPHAWNGHQRRRSWQNARVPHSQPGHAGPGGSAKRRLCRARQDNLQGLQRRHEHRISTDIEENRPRDKSKSTFQVKP